KDVTAASPGVAFEPVATAGDGSRSAWARCSKHNPASEVKNSAEPTIRSVRMWTSFIPSHLASSCCGPGSSECRFCSTHGLAATTGKTARHKPCPAERPAHDTKSEARRVSVDSKQRLDSALPHPKLKVR